MNDKIFFRTIVVLFVFALTFQACGPSLVKNNKTDFTIVLSASPDPVEQTAAIELKTYLDEITKTDWVIASENDISDDDPQILIGNSSRAKKFFPEIDQDQIPYDGIEVHLKGNKLLLTGHKQRGTLYAVYTFLEDVLGVRWWTATEQKVPSYNTFKLKPLNISYAPKLVYRNTNYIGAGMRDPVFATRLRFNANRNAPEYGDNHRIIYSVHTFYRLIPPERYFEEHPEWFSQINGVRNHASGQLCLTNEEMRKELTKNAKDALRADPGAKFISISQMDRIAFCQCEECTKIAEEEEAQSGPLIRFINAVAEEIEEEFPDVYVETLAYQYTRTPPKNVKPRKNVMIRLCTIECSFVEPLSGAAEQNKLLYNDIVGWGKISPQLFVWDYVTDFSSYVQPHPNLRVLAPNIRFFVDQGTIGLFEQGDSYSTVGDFVRLRNWLISRLMWNPTLDENKLIQEFLVGYYGEKAAPFLQEYFNVIIDRAESTGLHIGCFHENTDRWLDYETLCKATAVFNRAIAAAESESGKDSEFVQRLRRERLPIDHVWLKGYDRFKWEAEKKGEPFLGPANPEEFVKDFFATCEKYDVSALREYQTASVFAYIRDNMLNKFGTPTPVPDEFSSLDEKARMDVQEYDFYYGSRALGSTVDIVDDSAASNGRAMKMFGNRSGEAARILIDPYHPLFENAAPDTKYKIIIYARCDATAKGGLAMTCNINEQRVRGSITQRNVNVPEIAGSEYKRIEFEPISIKPTILVQETYAQYFQPAQSHAISFNSPNREGEVQAIYIDRVLIVKE